VPFHTLLIIALVIVLNIYFDYTCASTVPTLRLLAELPILMDWLVTRVESFRILLLERMRYLEAMVVASSWNNLSLEVSVLH
jgi:hypothetical protein